MEKPKPKRVYWSDGFGYKTSDPNKAKMWIARWKWRVTRVTVYSARELREWERQREAEIRREERERIADWLKKEMGYGVTADLVRHGEMRKR